jgi:hypothetical protein
MPTEKIRMKGVLNRILFREKRRYPRYRLKESALFVYDPHSRRDEELVDISLGGLAFIYFEVDQRLEKDVTVDVVSEGIFHLGKTHFQPLSDVVIAELVNRSTYVHRIGGRFVNMTPSQEFDLRKFLRENGRRRSGVPATLPV